MPHKQKHRGQHTSDKALFSEKWIPILNLAVDDLSYLMSRGYSDSSSLKLVGDRYRLKNRHRKALWRAACSDSAKAYRRSHQVHFAELSNRSLVIDGFNLLITVESCLAGACVFHCRDGSYRDIASIHGTYRKVEETEPALTCIGTHLAQLPLTSITWYFDAPMSNSGRLKSFMDSLAREHDFNWVVELVPNPDPVLVEVPGNVVVSADGWVLDHAQAWFNFTGWLLPHLSKVNTIELAGSLQA